MKQSLIPMTLTVCLACLLMSCSESELLSNQNAETGQNDSNPSSFMTDEQKTLVKKNLYQENRNDKGEVVTLPGFESRAKNKGMVVTQDDINNHADQDLFTYTAPPEMEAEYSDPVMITGSHLTLAPDVGETSSGCLNTGYKKDLPDFSSLSGKNGLFYFCIRLREKHSPGEFYVVTPAFFVGDAALKAGGCIDPDLNLVASTVLLTLCNGQQAKGTMQVREICKKGQNSCDKGNGSALAQECSGSGQSNCYVSQDSGFETADMREIRPENIRSGVTVAGIRGAFPSENFPLSGSNSLATDLTAATFDARIKSDAVFEYWDRTGQRHTGSGDSDIKPENILGGASIFGTTGTGVGSAAEVSPWDLRVGVQVGNVTGMLRLNCRNAINNNIYNSDNPGNFGDTSGTSNDWWDTIDNENNTLAAIPRTMVTGWSTDTFCSGEINFQDVTADGACDSAQDECIFQDRISGLYWSEGRQATSTWSNAVNYCNNLNHGGYSDWRLPTQFELAQGAINGLHNLGYRGGTPSLASNNQNFISDLKNTEYWSATTDSEITSNVRVVRPDSVAVLEHSKDDPNLNTICVR